MKPIALAKPELGQAEAQAAGQAILSGWVTQGPRVAEMERAFCAQTGAPFACAVSNCTAALHMALVAAGAGHGDVVVTVSHSFIATANAVRQCGAEPVFVDIDLDTFNMSPQALAACLKQDFDRRADGLWYRHVDRLLRSASSPLARAKAPLGRLAAIQVVHQVGMPADLEPILALAKAAGVPVVKNALGYDDSLDVFGVHCVGGHRRRDRHRHPGQPRPRRHRHHGLHHRQDRRLYDFWVQITAQCKAVLTTLVWSGVGSAIIYKIVDVIVGLRPKTEAEREGLDLTDHNERAYNY